MSLPAVVPATPTGALRLPGTGTPSTPHQLLVLVRATSTLQDDDTGIATISLRFDTQVLARIDDAAKRLGISRTAWLHLAGGERLDRKDPR
jgi:hypothetical protein